MGKVAGAALKVVAPEAAVAGKVAGKVGGKAGGKGPAPDPRKANPGSEAARQRQGVEDIKAARKPDPADQATEHQDPGHEDAGHEDAGHEDAGDALAGGPFGSMTAPSTGAGFLLGLIVWAAVRAYIGNDQLSGMAGVKALMLAKCFNKNPNGTYMTRHATPSSSTSSSGGSGGSWAGGTDSGGGF